jgi:hypothetical protein
VNFKRGKIMNKFNEYYNARNEITNIIKQDLLGPVTEDEKITGELPVNYYLVGKLYPQDVIKYDNPEIVQSMSEYKENDMEKSDFAETFDEIALCNTSNPSSMGISFSVNNAIEKIKVIVSYAKYLPFEQEETEQSLDMSTEESEEEKTTKKKRKQYKREFYKYERILSVKNPKIEPTIEDSNVLLRVNRRKTYDDTNTTTITISLSNTKSKCKDIEEKSIFTLFQPEIKLEAIDKNTFSPIKRNLYLAESEEMDLLYTNDYYLTVNANLRTWNFTTLAVSNATCFYFCTNANGEIISYKLNNGSTTVKPDDKTFLRAFTTLTFNQ